LEFRRHTSAASGAEEQTMRRLMKALVGGSLVFGLVAAAASAATFGLTIEDVVRAGTSDRAAAVTFVEQVCDGDYEIFWESEDATIIGFSAYPDTESGTEAGLAFCAEQPFVLQISDGIGGWVVEEVSTSKFTDAMGGILGARFLADGGIQFDDGDEVRLVIGPDAATF
jgi:hypothetical protein